jgi:hypothetical protein
MLVFRGASPLELRQVFGIRRENQVEFVEVASAYLPSAEARKVVSAPLSVAD